MKKLLFLFATVCLLASCGSKSSSRSASDSTVDSVSTVIECVEDSIQADSVQVDSVVVDTLVNE